MFLRIEFQALFEAICKATVERDELKLEEICRETSIDLFGPEFLLSPAGWFAKKNDYPSALWLLKKGANPHLIAYGAAIAGDRSFAEEMRNIFGANPHHIAKGAAIFGDFDYAYFLHAHHGASIIMIAEGAAMGGHLDEANKILAAYPDEKAFIPITLEYSEVTNIVSYVVRGAILGGYVSYAKNLMTQHEALILYKRDIAMAASIANNRVFAEELRKKYELPLFDFIVGATLGGHQDYFEFLIRIGKEEGRISSINEIISKTLAFRGYIDPSFFQKKKSAAEVDPMILGGLIMGRHTKMINNLIDFVSNQHFFSATIKSQLKLTVSANFFGDFSYAEYLYNEVKGFNIEERHRAIIRNSFASLLFLFYENEASALHQLSFIDNKAFLHELRWEAVETLEELNFSAPPNLDLDVTAILKHQAVCINIMNVIPLAIKINEIKTKYDLDYDTAKIFFENKDLRNMLHVLTFSLRLNNSPSEVSLLILMNLSLLTYNQTYNLCHNVSLFHKKAFLIKDLNDYSQNFLLNQFKEGKKVLTDFSNGEDLSQKVLSLKKYCHRFFNNNLAAANNLKLAINQANTNQDLRVTTANIPIPAQENERDQFHAIVEKHHRRFKF